MWLQHFRVLVCIHVYHMVDILQFYRGIDCFYRNDCAFELDGRVNMAAILQ